jgi:hypothetical protein
MAFAHSSLKMDRSKRRRSLSVPTRLLSSCARLTNRTCNSVPKQRRALLAAALQDASDQRETFEVHVPNAFLRDGVLSKPTCEQSECAQCECSQREH